MRKVFQVIPLGGCGEIGMNLTLWCVDDSYYFVDCGTLFADEHHPGMDLIFPSLDCLRERGIKPTAWLITHGHEDHIGALPYVYEEFPAPIYTTLFTAELIKEKFFGVLSDPRRIFTSGRFGSALLSATQRSLPFLSITAFQMPVDSISKPSTEICYTQATIESIAPRQKVP